MTFIYILLTLIISAFTGWMVIRILMRFLFKPAKLFSVAGFKVQGILPANQVLLAEQTAAFVSLQLQSSNALEKKITNPENFNKLKPEIETHIDTFLRVRLKDTFPMLAMMIGDKTINQLKGAFLIELETLFPLVMERYLKNLANGADLKAFVEEKINDISIPALEAGLHKIAGKQLLKLQLMGAAFGLLMGFVHLLVNLLLLTP